MKKETGKRVFPHKSDWTTPSREKLKTMIAEAGLNVRQAIREKGTPYRELGLEDISLTDDQLLDAMLAHPILINRPFVVTPMGTRLSRPSEVVLDILPPASSMAHSSRRMAAMHRPRSSISR